MRGIVTVGLGFGDEGKGATVDFLVREYQADLVVRFSGGAQAGHNVELPTGERHTFSQFGAGTFAGAATYLGPRMIICPATLTPEAEHLKSLGIDDPFRDLSAHPGCLLTTRYHQIMNRLRELSRGGNRHGSCGLGIGETRGSWLQYGQDAITAEDSRDPHVLNAKLRLLRARCLQNMENLERIDGDLATELKATSPAGEADALMEAMTDVTLKSRMPTADTVIFEGSQGVLLDEWFGFHPYTTWSTVTAEPAWEMIEQSSFERVTVLGLTRAYTTRHGAGPFPTWDQAMTARLSDPGNPENAWQGQLKSGPLDLMLLRYALESCPVDGLVVNHLDQFDAKIPVCRNYDPPEPLPIPQTLAEQTALGESLNHARPRIEFFEESEILGELRRLAPVVLTSRGPTWQDRTIESGQTILLPARK